MMIDRHEERRLTRAGQGRGRVSTLHLVHLFGADSPFEQVETASEHDMAKWT